MSQQKNEGISRSIPTKILEGHEFFVWNYSLRPLFVNKIRTVNFFAFKAADQTAISSVFNREILLLNKTDVVHHVVIRFNF